MKHLEKIQTIRNVISDLEIYLEQFESPTGEYDLNEIWQNAKLSAEHITEDMPLL